MNQEKQIAPKYLPTMPPVSFTAVVWLLLDRHAAPGWVWGACWCLVGLQWLTFVVRIFTTKWVKPSEI